MTILSALEHGLQAIIDGFYAHWPQTLPSPEQLQQAKIVAHRGAHESPSIPENTWDAFERAVQAGIWGLECDIRWTQDLEPVILHDANLQRVFGDSRFLCELSWKEVHRAFPAIPSLAEFLARYAGRCHLMLELKAEPYPEPERQKSRLAQLLAPLEPRRDFHILGLASEVFQYVDFLPKNACLPVAELNISAFSELSLKEGYAGLAGHYVLIHQGLLQLHHAQGQAIGTGFIASPRALYRELQRGVDWIFTNNALLLQQELKHLEG